ncbi:MAG: hypothetical protein HYY37_02300 [Candidatus Aenigmarchaeota archaeon]|nr:hypothetical protein [Candidatus Aenigmarchaeota archaeon]
MEEEYEIIPVSPIRRIERRLERLERIGTGSESNKELIEIVKANQHVIDDMVRINSEMMSRMSSLLESVHTMTGKVNEFMSRIEVAGEKPSENSEESKDLERKMDERLVKLEKRVNAMLLTAIAKRKAGQ